MRILFKNKREQGICPGHAGVRAEGKLIDAVESDQAPATWGPET